jgi:hypothetical protein
MRPSSAALLADTRRQGVERGGGWAAIMAARNVVLPDSELVAIGAVGLWRHQRELGQVGYVFHSYTKDRRNSYAIF